MSIKEHHVHKRSNNHNIAQYNKPQQFTNIMRYLHDPLMQPSYRRTKSFYFNNTEQFVECLTWDERVLKIAWEFRHKPNERVPNRNLKQYVIYLDGEELAYRGSQKLVEEYLSIKVFKERQTVKKD